ncbi:MAG: hypothetical protein JWN03_4048 [Nocardia sp.]|uniref:hypothetical protein n=1 Tax=Nocardia sp. TaxID=1821 RepID=UPI0026057B9E|nr:hypothetical protein [Nocardia sp.]MCU1643773.1 hypothetical protein [Nocardia sp.]
MRQQPGAIGYLRHDVSAAHQQWDIAQIQHLAKRLGYDLCKMLVFGPETDQPMEQLRDAVSQLEADAVITVDLEHFDGDVPDGIVDVADVITVNPENTYTRWVVPPT